MDSLLTTPEMIGIDQWGYAPGNPNEGLVTTILNKPLKEERITTPHRVSLPDSPLWYSSKIKFEGPILLHVNADDGAQVFYNEEQLFQEFPYYYRLEPTLDSSVLVIRVLNNALKGGLIEVAYANYDLGKLYISNATKLKKNAPYIDSLCLFKGYFSDIELTQPTIFVEPFVQRSAPLEYEIKIITNLFNEPILRYGTHPLMLDKKISPTKYHGFLKYSLHNKENFTLYYQFVSKTLESKLYKLEAEPESDNFSFSAWGDSQGGWYTFSELTKMMISDSLGFSIGLGDLVSDGSAASQWNAFCNALQPLASSIPVYPVIGNHDYDGYYDDLIPTHYKAYIREETYFSWQYQNAAFIALDPNETFPLGIENTQKEWFLSEIHSEAWKQSKWRFIVLHQPPYAQGWPEYHGDQFIRDLIKSYAESAKIDFVLSGHSHCYERLSLNFNTQKTHFIVLGGAGGSLEPAESSKYPVMDKVIKKHHYGLFKVKENEILFKVIGLNNEVLDSLTFEKSRK